MSSQSQSRLSPACVNSKQTLSRITMISLSQYNDMVWDADLPIETNSTIRWSLNQSEGCVCNVTRTVTLRLVM